MSEIKNEEQQQDQQIAVRHQFTKEQHKMHPFIEGLRNPPSGREKELNKIRQWMESQPHFPYISDEYIYLFLHACYYEIDATKSAIENYFTIRAHTPGLFANRDAHMDKIKLMLKTTYVTTLPKTTPKGYKVLMYVLQDSDPANFYFAEAAKGFCMYNDCVLSEAGLCEGFLVVFDMKYVKFGHIARISFPIVRAFLSYIQEAHPARLKGVHVLNTASFINHLMRLITPLIKSDLIGLLKFHAGNAPDEETIPLEMMPCDYGGEAPTLEELGQDLHRIIEKYDNWWKETEHFVADESKRTKKSSWWSIFGNSNVPNSSSNNSNIIIENATLKNLQVD